MDIFDHINRLERLQDLVMPKSVRDVMQEIERKIQLQHDVLGDAGLARLGSSLDDLQAAIGPR